MRTFVLGDIHGNIKALEDVLKQVQFNYEEDRLIFLGDVADGWDWVPECVDVFMKIKNFVWCLGNHDKWTVSYFLSQEKILDNLDDPVVIAEALDARHTWAYYWRKYENSDTGLWLNQGGQVTFDAYEKMRKEDFFKWVEHKDFWLNKPELYVIEDNKLFVHGGIDARYAITNQPNNWIYYWDRDMWYKAIGLEAMNANNIVLVENGPGVFMRNNRKVRDYCKESGQTEIKKIFIGHTVVDARWNYTEQVKPQNKAGVWNLDTGAGSSGNACLFNLDKGKYYLSELASTYYPDKINAKMAYAKKKYKK